ncbi:SurA N-terminal domain-containing protein [Flavobacterium agricola]|uniref:Periplasmic chaperone PpiD n=1 Tax=Flavobacterium agricola TaxID=2870839 RepID=A0ABY6LYK2_9FLAO|nr:SurA N-terminal domain-containing protein [Flavobacterium agricola]UYW01319.1 SurA N-terminal domain-containing protein [Flavobacterium agricola]
MAVLSKIRKNSVLLVGAIGVGLFAFVIGDVFQSGGFDQNSRYIGSVNGTDILAQNFLAKVNNLESNGQGSLSQVSNQVWNQEVKSIILDEQFEKIGIVVGKDQLLQYIVNSPEFSQNPQFLNSAGVFDINKFKEFLATIRKTSPEQWQAWLGYEAQLEQFAKEQMYNSLISASIYTTKFDAQTVNFREATFVDFDYVTLQYSTVADDQAQVSDAEITAYVKKHAKLFKTVPTRSFEYVFVENKPSENDIKDVNAEMMDLLNGKVVYNAETGQNENQESFKTTTNVAEFVNANSEMPFDSSYVTKALLPLEYQEQLANLPVGEVFGPYDFDEYALLTRKLEAKKNASAKVSHILISHAEANSPIGSTRTKEEAKVLADSLLNQVRTNPAALGILAMQYTDDPGSKQTGGVYDNVQRGQMVPEFDKFLFNNAVGATGVVETDFGYHVMRVDEFYDGMKLATIVRRVQPSAETQDELFKTANLVFAEASEGANLADVAKKHQVVAMPTVVGKNDDQINGLGSSREIVQWAFNKATKVDEVKKFDIATGQVIVKVTEKNDSDLMTASQAKAYVEPILRNEKKAAILKAKLTGSTLADMAKNAQTAVSVANNITLANPNIAGLGIEQEVVGAAIGLGVDKISPVIAGNTGVFVVQAKAIKPATPLVNPLSKTMQINQQVRGTAAARVYQSLENKAKIEDNRYIFR